MGYTITLIIGITFFFISLFHFYETYNFLKTGNRTTAKVVEILKETDSDGTTYTPIFAFRTDDNKRIKHKHFQASEEHDWVLGQTVSIVYDPIEPENARVLTFWGTFSWAISFMALALPLLFICFGNYIFNTLLLKY